MSDFVDDTYKRVAQVIFHKHLNIKSFEDKIKVSNNSVGTAIRRKTSFKSSVLNKILNCFPEINPTWLLTGKEKMLLETEKSNSIAKETDLSYRTQNLEEQIKDSVLSLLLEDKEVQTALSTYVKKEVKNL